MSREDEESSSDHDLAGNTSNIHSCSEAPGNRSADQLHQAIHHSQPGGGFRQSERWSPAEAMAPSCGHPIRCNHNETFSDRASRASRRESRPTFQSNVI